MRIKLAVKMEMDDGAPMSLLQEESTGDGPPVMNTLASDSLPRKRKVPTLSNGAEQTATANSHTTLSATSDGMVSLFSSNNIH
jgi:hypothetical protein